MQPVYLFALVGIGFAFMRAIETGREGLAAGLILPAGYVWLMAFH